MCDAGITKLMKAAEGGHTEIVRGLLQKGADANASDNTGKWRGASRAVGAQDD
jgi:ankyrin repeat protein